MPDHKQSSLDLVTGLAGLTIVGWFVAVTRGYGLMATTTIGTLLGLAYFQAPSRTFSTGEQVTNSVDLTGKTAFITGATSGIGKETARVLALRGAHVYLAARNSRKLEDTKTEILKDLTNKQGSTKVSTLVCDLNDLQSVQYCAKTFLAQNNNALDILILNAGVMNIRQRTSTAQGLESQVGVCHVGHFYLTKLLLPALTKGDKGSRVVVLSGSLYYQHDFSKCLSNSKLETEPYDGWKAYGNAKCANMLFAKALNDNNKQFDNVTAYSVHPGVVFTGLQSNVDWWTILQWNLVAPFFFKTTQQGSATTLFCATKATTSAEGGNYFDDCECVPETLSKVLEELGDDAPQRCWDITEQLLKNLGFSS